MTDTQWFAFVFLPAGIAVLAIVAAIIFNKLNHA